MKAWIRMKLRHGVIHLMEWLDIPRHDAKATWIGDCRRCRLDTRLSASWWPDHQKAVLERRKQP